MVLLGICLRLDFDNEENRIIVFEEEESHIALQINESYINHEDFTIIRDIICKQNDIDMSIFELDPQVRIQLIQTLEYQARHNQSEMGTLEDQIIAVMINTNYSIEQIEAIPIRKFRKILERVDHTLHYKIYKTASLSGFVTFKEEYPHWLAKLNRNNVSTNVSSYDDIKQKIGTKVC